MIFLDFLIKMLYNNKTRLDGELAVPCNLQSAIAGLNASLGISRSKMYKLILTMKSRSHATFAPEPCQVLTEASLREYKCVP